VDVALDAADFVRRERGLDVIRGESQKRSFYRTRD
jgi:hypothetical protein